VASVVEIVAKLLLSSPTIQKELFVVFNLLDYSEKGIYHGRKLPTNDFYVCLLRRWHEQESFIVVVKFHSFLSRNTNEISFKWARVYFWDSL
jgi:hypothetical protein